MKIKLTRLSTQSEHGRKCDSNATVEWEITENGRETVYVLEDGKTYIHNTQILNETNPNA